MTIYVCKNKKCGIFFNSDELDKCPDCGTPTKLTISNGYPRRQFCWRHGYYNGTSACPVCVRLYKTYPREMELVVEKP